MDDIIIVFATIMVIIVITRIKFSMYIKKQITHACGKLCLIELKCYVHIHYIFSKVFFAIILNFSMLLSSVGLL